MLNLSNDAYAIVAGAKPDTKLSVPLGTLYTYSGKSCDALRVEGYLNLVLVDKLGKMFGFSVSDFENSNMRIVGQEKMKRFNSSEIMGISCKENRVFLQHWEGFRTELDVNDLSIKGQVFTK